MISAPAIPGYQIIREVGRGGMGVVYEATQLSLDRRVALKVLPEHLAGAPGFVDRFKREASTAARMEHPHIVPVYDFGQADGQFFIVMQFVEGQTLDQMIVRGQPMSAAMAIEILQQIAEALDHAHRLGVVHRDVKPANIIIRADNGQAMLMDFGVAKATASTQMTSAGATIGTPDYMAPEACRGEQATARSDIYSLGCVAFEMLTGQRPFAAPDSMAVMYKHINEQPPSISGVNRAIGRQADPRLAHILDKEPARRPASASGAIADLRRALSGTAAQAPQRGAARRTTATRTGSNRRILGIGLGVVLLALIGVGVWLRWSGGEPPAPNDLPVVRGLTEADARETAQSAGWQVKDVLQLWHQTDRHRAIRCDKLGAAKADGLRLWMSKGPEPSEDDKKAARSLAEQATADKNEANDYFARANEVHRTLTPDEVKAYKVKLVGAADKAQKAIGLNADEKLAYVTRAEALLLASLWEDAKDAVETGLAEFPGDAELDYVAKTLEKKGYDVQTHVR